MKPRIRIEAARPDDLSALGFLDWAAIGGLFLMLTYFGVGLLTAWGQP